MIFCGKHSRHLPITIGIVYCTVSTFFFELVTTVLDNLAEASKATLLMLPFSLLIATLSHVPLALLHAILLQIAASTLRFLSVAGHFFAPAFCMTKTNVRMRASLYRVKSSTLYCAPDLYWWLFLLRITCWRRYGLDILSL